MKIIVFDLDETLGYFTQFGIFMDCLSNCLNLKNKDELTQIEFNDILDLYPEFLRPGIENILIYLKKKKQSGCCNKMMIYTNNTGPREWSQRIINYFENKINFKLIDQIIYAFKINNERIELCRTSHDKTHVDLIKCTKLPHNTEICYIDDYFYKGMTNDNIYYIHIKPYYNDLHFENMINLFINSDVGNKLIYNADNIDNNIELFKRAMMDNIKKFNYLVVKKKVDDHKVDIIVGKHIMYHLQIFFNRSLKNKSLKNTKKSRNKTHKNYTTT